MNTLPYICGITFAPAGNFAGKCKAKPELMQERTNANFIDLVTGGLQDTPQSEQINYVSNKTMTDSELKQIIDYAHALGLRAALKLTVNCKNGTWRAQSSCEIPETILFCGGRMYAGCRVQVCVK